MCMSSRIKHVSVSQYACERVWKSCVYVHECIYMCSLCAYVVWLWVGVWVWVYLWMMCVCTWMHACTARMHACMHEYMHEYIHTHASEWDWLNKEMRTPFAQHRHTYVLDMVPGATHQRMVHFDSQIRRGGHAWHACMHGYMVHFLTRQVRLTWNSDAKILCSLHSNNEHFSLAWRGHQAFFCKRASKRMMIVWNLNHAKGERESCGANKLVWIRVLLSRLPSPPPDAFQLVVNTYCDASQVLGIRALRCF